VDLVRYGTRHRKSDTGWYTSYIYSIVRPEFHFKSDLRSGCGAVVVGDWIYIFDDFASKLRVVYSDYVLRGGAVLDGSVSNNDEYTLRFNLCLLLSPQARAYMG
jgi:hypothetical protein